MNPKKLFSLCLAVAGGALLLPTAPVSAAQGDASFVSVTGNITRSTRWTRDKVYLLTRMIFVQNNAVLTIEPGTIIRGMGKGAAGTDFANEPGTLIVSRGGKLIANGTPDDPIIMTSIDDPQVPGGISTVPLTFRNAKGAVKSVTPKNYSPDGPQSNNGFAHCEEWGGLVMLGRALVSQGSGMTVNPRPFNDNGLVVNNLTFKGADVIEGIDATRVPNTSGPASAKLGVYGGTNDQDNSGVLRFVSIRYAGDVIGESNELNSLTVGGLGENTVIEHVESTFNTDDGFEWFGGKNNPRFLFSLYNRDDAFDGDEGVRIRGQFWTAFQGADSIARSNYAANNTVTGHDVNSSPGASVVSYNQLMEFDGPEPAGTISAPAATVVDLYNFTFVGRGTLGLVGERGIRFRERAEGFLRNGVFEIFAGSGSPFSASSANNTSGSYKLEVNNFHYDSTRLSAPSIATLNAENYANEASRFTAVTGAVAQASSQLRSKLPYNRYTGGADTGVDLRLVSGGGTARQTNGAATPPAGYVQVSYAGSQRDNTHLNGWSNLQYLGVLPSDHSTRLSITMGLNGSNNPQVTFAFKGRGAGTVDYADDAIFVVERSADGRVWTPVKSVVNGNANDTDGNAADASITVTDDATTLGTGAALRYRAYAL